MVAVRALQRILERNESAHCTVIPPRLNDDVTTLACCVYHTMSRVQHLAFDDNSHLPSICTALACTDSS
jgi:hypothetical protein